MKTLFVFNIKEYIFFKQHNVSNNYTKYNSYVPSILARSLLFTYELIS